MPYTSILLIGSAILLLAWSAIATILWLRAKNQSNNCSLSLNAAQSAGDQCKQFCGQPGGWVQAQKDALSKQLMNLLTVQKVITCPNPDTDLPKLANCALDSLSQQYSYWKLTDQTNLVGILSILISSLKTCASNVTGCSVSKSL